MLYIIARLFDALARPSTLLLLLALVGVVLTLRRRLSAWGARCLVMGVGGLAAFAILPLSTWMLRPLEDRFPVPMPMPENVAGIIVLGGAVSVPRSTDRGMPELNRAAGRMTAFAMLARRYPRARLVFTGGNGDPFAVRPSEAAIARSLFAGLGLSRVLYESRSRNTHENAQFTASLLHPKPDETWLLVTTAADLPRAVGSFRVQGWPVIAYPADYHTLGKGTGFLPGLADGLADGDWAAHEWIGLVYYRLRGWTPALLPGPEK